jgi:hypothetical protein
MALGDHLNKQIDVWREKQGLPAFTNAHLKTNSPRDPIADAVASIKKLSDTVAALKGSARGDDDDARQIIADLISDDGSPFTPDDDQALRMMSAASLREMRRKYLKRNSHTANSRRVVVNGHDPAIAAMSSVGLAGADFARRQAQLNANADTYARRNPIQRRAVTNSSDKAVQAMSANIGAAEYLRQKKEAQ